MGQMHMSYAQTRTGSHGGKCTRSFFDYLGDVRLFLESNEEAMPRIMDHLRKVMKDENHLCRLKPELAVMINIGRHFVAATYNLEGDRALALAFYKRLQAVANV